MALGEGLLVVACGALAREVSALVRANGWSRVTVQCLPAELHNRPERIPAAVRERLQAAAGRFERTLVAYGDCGTSGALDSVLEEFGAERLPGPHCYAVYAGQELLEELAAAEPGTFYLTDFLVRHFDRLVVRALGMDRHPELGDLYFAHYSRVVYLAQTDSPELLAGARQAAERLGLRLEHRHTGYGRLHQSLRRAVGGP